MRTICLTSFVLLLSLIGDQVIAQTAECTPLDEASRITDDPGDSDRASLVWTGTEYGVAWHDDRDGDTEIYFTRIDVLGDEIGDDVRITNQAGSSSEPSLVWTGSEYGVAWHDARDGDFEIYFTRLDALGNEIGDDVRVTNSLGNSVGPSLVWTGNEFGVGWSDGRDGNGEIYFARLDALGNKIGNDARITNDSELSAPPSVVWTGSGYGLVWHDTRDGNFEVYFTRLDAFGNEIGDDVRVVTSGIESVTPSVVWTGSEYGVAWRSERDGNWEIYLTRLDALGNEIGEYTRVTNAPDSTGGYSLVWSGIEYGLAFGDTRDGNWDIYFTRLAPSGNKIGDDIKIASTPEGSGRPSMVFTDLRYGVAWQDGPFGGYEVYFAQVACACTDFEAHSAYGRLLFQTLCTQDASNLTEDVYDGKTVGINKGPNDAFYLSAHGMRFAPLVVDDVVLCDGQDSGLGPYAPQPGVPPFFLDVPIELNLVPLPAHEITSLIPSGTSHLPFELLDVDRSIYGHTAVYLVRDCGIHVGNDPFTTLYWHSHDVEVVGMQSDLEVVSGLISELRTGQDFSRACFLDSFIDESEAVDHRGDPPLGDGYYYLVNGTCASPIGYGNSSAGPRGDFGFAPQCPGVVFRRPPRRSSEPRRSGGPESPR